MRRMRMKETKKEKKKENKSSCKHVVEKSGDGVPLLAPCITFAISLARHDSPVVQATNQLASPCRGSTTRFCMQPHRSIPWCSIATMRTRLYISSCPLRDGDRDWEIEKKRQSFAPSWSIIYIPRYVFFVFLPPSLLLPSNLPCSSNIPSTTMKSFYAVAVLALIAVSAGLPGMRGKKKCKCRARRTSRSSTLFTAN